MKKTLLYFLLIASFWAITETAHVYAQLEGTGKPQLPVRPPPPRPTPIPSVFERQDAQERIGESRYGSTNARPMDTIRKDIKDRLKISDDQRDSYRAQAGDKKARVARVFSSYSCSTSLVLDVSDPRCLENPDLQIVSYYSFRFKDYGEGPWTDVNFVEDNIVTGNKWHTTGLIVDLGTGADFAKIDEKSAEVSTMWNFPEAETIEDKVQQKVDLEDGIKSGEFVLRSKLKVQPNHTYIVRTISYRPRRGFYSGFAWYNTDSIFVFKVMEVNENRTVTLVWKKLQQKVAPILESKRERSARK